MGYAKEIYQKAQRALDESRAAAQRDAERRRAALYAELPQLAQIERELSATGLAAAQAAISGGGDAPKLIDELRARNLALQERRARILRDAGKPADALEVCYACPKCEDTGYIGQTQCACLKTLLRELAYESLGDMSGAGDCRFETFDLSYYPVQPCGPYNIVPRRAMEKVLSACRDYARTFSLKSESLLFLGGTGLGKTHLSLAIAHEVISQGYGVVYTTAPRLLDRLQTQQFSRGAGGGTDYQALVGECDLLVIDDLGAEFSTSFSVAALYNLINSRIIERRPTVISTNFDEQVLRERYGDRILSRLLCAYRPMQFYGEDIRMLKRYGQ